MMERTITGADECHGLVSMPSPLWSDLPFDLLLLVIAQTTDTETQDSWCEVTRGSHLLHKTALSTRWKTVTIDDRDLLPAPGDDEEFFQEIKERLQVHSLGQNWKPAGQMVNTLLSAIDSEPGRCPANYVQHLVLDFRLLRYWEDDVQDYWEYVDPDWEDDADSEEEPPTYNAWDLMPTLKSLQFTLGKLEGHFHNLHSLSCHGDTHQAILDFVAKSDAVKIRGLELRSLGAYGGFQIPYKDEQFLRRWPLQRWLFRFEGLSVLHQLRSLDIHRLSNAETNDLLAVLPNLVQLHCLTLACESGEHNDDYPKLGGCALKSLFDQIFQNRDVPSSSNDRVAESSRWFPSSLESLSLIDTYYSKTQWMPVPITQSPLFNNHLIYLCLDLGNLDCIPMLVDCFPNDTLQCISLPGSSYNAHALYRGFDAHVDHAIVKHKEPLDRIRLVRAWKTDLRWIDEFVDRWSGAYEVQELVLGTRNPEWYYLCKLSPKPTLSHYLCGFHGDTHGDIGRWGSRIERIRIDHVDISDLEVSVLSEPPYSRLNILMLQPAPRGSYDSILSGCKAIDESVCFELAKRVISQAAPSLRVVVIADHWYWAPRDSSGGALWTWADAMDDSSQYDLILSSLSKAELDFLHDSTVPYWHERNLFEWHRRLGKDVQKQRYEPSTEMFNQWNYLTGVRSHEE